MGNANTHERRKSGGVSETGPSIEDIRSPPALVIRDTSKEDESSSPGNKKTPPPSFQTASLKGDGVSGSAAVPAAGADPVNEPFGCTRALTNDFRREEAALDNSSNRLPTIIKYPGDGKEVYVCGSFSEWKKIPMVKSQKDFVALINLPVGEHQYKFLVDDEWLHDTNQPAVKNEIGSKNNVIKIHQEDFDAFSALDMDSKSTNLRHKRSGEREFGQEIPSVHSFENKAGPPVLPPHLLQVILNKDTPLSCEPTLLPEPNHVMINHLYALSIKDGVMVISSTQRYRKKYVTTLLYKPIEGAA